MKKFILALAGATVLSLSPGYAAIGLAEENVIQEEQLSGWVNKDGRWYYYDQTTGQPVTGWLKDQEKWYYLDRSGAMVTGWTVVDDKNYYLNNQGVMQTGWLNNGGRWHYLNKYGVQQTGWVLVEGKWYFLDATDMITGWHKDNDKWYYMNKHGVMQTGWLLDSGKWYYLDKHGALVKGLLELNGKTYYMDRSGAMVTGWKWTGDQWYHFEASGLASSGWKFLSGNWYYFNTGYMAKQQVVDGYYLAKDGKMSTAGSKEIVNVVESLKKSIQPEITKTSIKQKLGIHYRVTDGHHGEFWSFALDVTKSGQYSTVTYQEDNPFEVLAKGNASIILTAYWNGDKAFKVDMFYFDQKHQLHTYTYLKADHQYN